MESHDLKSDYAIKGLKAKHCVQLMFTVGKRTLFLPLLSLRCSMSPICSKKEKKKVWHSCQSDLAMIEIGPIQKTYTNNKITLKDDDS